jgi:hypothetical protein
MKRERLLWPLVLLGAALLTLACFHQVLTYGFTDKDTLLHITEARVENLGDLGALPFKELTGGRSARDANFYRPTVMLMYAGLRAAFGWEPLGYHAFDLALHSLNGLLLALFAASCARRAGLVRPRGFGVLCAGIFVIHPLGVETVPAIARNGDLLVTAFFLAALLALDRAQRGLARGDSWRSQRMLARLAAFTGLYALTLGSKEPGIVLLGAAFLYVALVGRDGDPKRRVLRAGLLVLPCLAVTAGYLAVRMRVMGELLGGYDVEYPAAFMANHVTNMMAVDLSVPGYAHRIPALLAQLGIDATPGSAWPLGMAVAAVVLWALLVRIASPRSEPDATPPARGRSLASALTAFLHAPGSRLIAFAGAVIAAYAALFIVTDVYDRRLLCTVVAFSSFLPALAIHWALTSGRAAHFLRRLPSLAALAAAAGVFLLQSPLVHRYDEWRSTGEAAFLLTEGSRKRWERMPDGSNVVIFNMPASFTIDPMRRVMFAGLSSTNALAPNAVRAWLDDQFPDKDITPLALGYTRYSEPLAGFRHRANVFQGWLVFQTPRGTTDRDEVLEQWPQFQTAIVNLDSLRVAYRGRPVPPNLHVLVLDGHRPLLLAAEKIPGQPRQPPERSGE